MPMYPNYFQPPYYPAQIPMPDMRQPQMQTAPAPQPQTAPQPQSNNGLIWVQGEAGAKSYPVAPGATVMLMDSEDNRFYIKSADASGMPLPLRIFDYSERTGQAAPKPQNATNTADFVTRAEFDALKNRIDSMTTHAEKEAEEDG